jgi:hypothetical protein
MEFKNLTSFKDFIQIKEAKEFTNDTTWSESLLGKAVGGILKLFSNGFANGVFLHSIRNIKSVVLEGVEEYLSGTTKMSGSTETSPTETSPTETNPTETNPTETNPTETTDTTSDIENNTNDANKSTDRFVFTYGDKKLELKKISVENNDGTKGNIDVDKRGDEILSHINEPTTITDLIKDDIFQDVLKSDNIGHKSNTINSKITAYNNQTEEIKKLELTKPTDKKILNDLEIKKNKLKSTKLSIIYDQSDLLLMKFKYIKLREKISKLGGKLTGSGELFINGKQVDLETLQPIQKQDTQKIKGSEDIQTKGDGDFDTVEDGKIIPASKNIKNKIISTDNNSTGESVYYLEDEMINEALMGGTKNINKQIEELTLQQKNKINKESATQKINLSKLYAYHLLAERQYIKSDGTIDKTLENTWKKDVYKALSRFNDLVNINKANPFSQDFALNKEQKDTTSEESKKSIEATHTGLATANGVAERVKRLGLSETQVTAEYLRGKGINELYMLNLKWALRSKRITEYESMVAVKYMNIAGFDALCIIDTYSKDFMDNYDVSNNKLKNTKDINLIQFLIGTTFNMESGETSSIKNVPDYTSYFIFKNKLKFPVTTLFTSNEIHVFNMLKVNGKDEVFVPTLTNKQQEATTSDIISKAIMNDNLYKNKLNIISVDMFPVFGIPKTISGNYVTKNKINTNIINNFTNEIKMYFQKLSAI